MNRNDKILGRRLFSPSLKDVAWIEDAQVVFLVFFYSSVNLAGSGGSKEKIYRRIYGKLQN